MKLWKRATGALKDKYSIWVAKLSPYGPCRNPDLETIIIKATSHDEQCMDYKYVQRVFQWLRTSPLYLKPLLCAISMRMEKTRSWVVALKGLILIHGVFHFDTPMVQKMGRLPFDLSHFSDGHVNPEKGWVYNAFVRSYFAYLDQRSALLRLEAKRQLKNGKQTEEILMEELRNLEKLQGLIDLLLHIKPRSGSMNVVLILEAMDCVMDEILEVYGKFCKEIHRVLLRVIDIGGKEEASVALEVVKKAESQGDKLCLYFEFCRDIGVFNMSECPKIVKVSEKDIHELQRIKNWVPNEKAIVVRDCSATATVSAPENSLTTVITHQWEVFDDDIIVAAGKELAPAASYATNLIDTTNPFVECNYSIVPYVPVQHYDFPDLISL